MEAPIFWSDTSAKSIFPNKEHCNFPELFQLKISEKSS